MMRSRLDRLERRLADALPLAGPVPGLPAPDHWRPHILAALRDPAAGAGPEALELADRAEAEVWTMAALEARLAELMPSDLSAFTAFALAEVSCVEAEIAARTFGLTFGDALARVRADHAARLAADSRSLEEIEAELECELAEALEQHRAAWHGRRPTLASRPNV